MTAAFQAAAAEAREKALAELRQTAEQLSSLADRLSHSPAVLIRGFSGPVPAYIAAEHVGGAWRNIQHAIETFEQLT